MLPIPVFCSQTSPRLTFVLDWIFNEQLQTGYTLVDDISDAGKYPVMISYGVTLQNAISIPDCSLLWQTDIEQHTIATGKWNDLPVLYYSNETECNLPFDIFSAVFFLLSRYEEYYPFTPDKHNRYPATESILYKHDLLQRPIVDEWLWIFRKTLSGKFSLPPAKEFFFQPTYDIDIAYSYKHKGVKRTIGGYLQDLISARFNNIRERTASLFGKQDPYDSFDWLRTLHAENNYTPIYFILSAFRSSPYDKNISLSNSQMKTVARKLYAEGIVGIHPSYYSNRNPNLLSSEKLDLIKVVRNPVIISRQHYIKNKIPYTYNLLLSNTISADYSMGYATHIGFRSGSSHSFLWYNLKKEKTTKLRIYPFCFMDTTAKYELGLGPDEAFKKLEIVTDTLKNINGQLITIFHNFSLGTSPEWAGWKELYEDFLIKK